MNELPDIDRRDLDMLQVVLTDALEETIRLDTTLGYTDPTDRTVLTRQRRRAARAHFEAAILKLHQALEAIPNAS